MVFRAYAYVERLLPRMTVVLWGLMPSGSNNIRRFHLETRTRSSALDESRGCGRIQLRGARKLSSRPEIRHIVPSVKNEQPTSFWLAHLSREELRGGILPLATQTHSPTLGWVIHPYSCLLLFTSLPGRSIEWHELRFDAARTGTLPGLRCRPDFKLAG